MKIQSGSFLKNYNSLLLLIGGIIVGSVLGLIFGDEVEVIKPLGDIFLNLLFLMDYQLIFDSILGAGALVFFCRHRG